MAGKGLIVGIDYTDRYCQACYYSVRHGQPESVSAGTDVMRYLIPTVLSYDPSSGDWAIGNSALRMEEKPDVVVFRELMRNLRTGTSAFAGGQTYTYQQLLAVYFGKLLEFIQISTSVMAVENITITMKTVDQETKRAWEEVFDLLRISPGKIRLLSSAESFGYYMVHEDPRLWQDGALLFDFSPDGFFAKQLQVRVNRNGSLIYVDEYDFSLDFSVDHLSSETLRRQMDQKLLRLYQQLMTGNGNASVYFTGEGFDEQWFTETINAISGNRRAFKGNNIYVKGATLAGHLRQTEENGEFPILCKGRTRADISLEAWDNGKLVEILLSPAAVDWYDAGYQGDFILERERSLALKVTSLISGLSERVVLDLSTFPQRPEKATRISLQMEYRNEYECEITVTDKGFGDFYPDGGSYVSQILHLEGYSE